MQPQTRASIATVVAIAGLVSLAIASPRLSDQTPASPAATSSMAPSVRVAVLTDAAPCLGYKRERYHRLAVYVGATESSWDRAVHFENAGIYSGVNDAAHDLGRGYRLVPMRKIPNADWFGVWVRGSTEPITDSRKRALITGSLRDVVPVTAASLGVRCDGSVEVRTAKRRAVRR